MGKELLASVVLALECSDTIKLTIATIIRDTTFADELRSIIYKLDRGPAKPTRDV